jgi:choline monooxygenase
MPAQDKAESSRSEPGRVELPAAQWLLPPEAYTSEEWFRREQELLFRRCWAFAGMTDDVSAAGDYACVDVGGDPIVVVRHPGGELRAFHNVCRHRGARLLDGRGNVGRDISCFYHRWRYGLDGELKFVPQRDQFPSLCEADLGLHPASVDSWNGMIFVHVDPEPDAPLDEWLGTFRERMGPFDPLALHEVRTVRHELKANWKLFLENHVDGYHLWHLHARSIKGLDHARQEWRPAGRHWTFYEPASRPGAHADAAMTGLPVLASHGDSDAGFGSSVHLVFPNLGVAGGSTFWTTLQAIPLAADRTLVELRTRIAPIKGATKARATARYAGAELLKTLRRGRVGRALAELGLVRTDHASGADFVAEDLMAAEAIQATLRSSRFEVGPLAKDYEQSITFFQRNILDYVDA